MQRRYNLNQMRDIGTVLLLYQSFSQIDRNSVKVKSKFLTLLIMYYIFNILPSSVTNSFRNNEVIDNFALF